MRAGKLDRIITIERATETVTASGGVVSAWAIIATPRAEIVRSDAIEEATGFGEAENVRIVFRIRYVPGLASSDRVTFGDVAFNVVEIVEIGRKRGLELRCERIR